MCHRPWPPPVAPHHLDVSAFANDVEDAMGRMRFLVFYLLSGLAAAITQIVIDPASNIPMVGSSGAISGVMAYLVLLSSRPRVRTAPFEFLHNLNCSSCLADACLLDGPSVPRRPGKPR
jgi:Rhomboid family